MAATYVCKNNPEHIFNEPTEDFWCPECPIEHRGMLSMINDPEPEIQKVEIPVTEQQTIEKEPNNEPKPEPTEELAEELTEEQTKEPVEEPTVIPTPTPTEIPEEPIKPEVILTTSIGNQTWMKDYLKVNHINKEINLFLAKSDKDWKAAHSAKTPAYCFPNGDEQLAKEMGCLFNWYAVQLIAANPPIGFRVPDLDDINELNTNLLRSKSGFIDGDYGLKMSLPIAHRLPLATYADGSDDRCFWTCEQNVFYTAFSYRIDLEGKIALTRKIDKNAGYFVRCIQVS
jgi:uncharacterized protein (TIGR02145 family)